MIVCQELECLKKNYDELETKCKEAMKNFIEDEDKDVMMDKALMKACTAMIKTFCKVSSTIATQLSEVQLC